MLMSRSASLAIKSQYSFSHILVVLSVLFKPNTHVRAHTHMCTYETWRSSAMMERGSAAILASQVVHLIPSLTKTSLSGDSAVGGGGLALECAVAGCSG